MKTNEKDTKQGVVPALRFPEFTECGSWIYLRGDKVFKQISNKNHNSGLPILAISQEHGAVPRDLIDYKVIVSESGLENYKVVEIGDFIISLRSFQGGIEYSDYKGICSPAYVILRKRLDVENQFFKYYFKSHVFIRDLNKNLEGIRDGKMVSYKQFSEILLPIPSISDKREQQKIADCLSSIDNLIKATEDKIDELKAHKKGLMQQLFPAEGKTVPELRFPEFRECAEWIYLRGNQVFRQIANREHSSDLPVLAISQEYGAVPRDLINYNVIVSDTSLQNYKVVDVEDFIISLRSFQGGIEYSGYKGICSPAYVILRKKIDIDNLFFKYYFKTDRFIRNLTKNLEGIRDGKMISYHQFSEILLPIPTLKNKKEQQKIADCLSSVDDLITAQMKHLEAFRAHKKGLMQQLFPNIDRC